ncbi:hypothetical protein SADUNF_Sadunf05G0068900 [Salix dunnii]|uniref:Uncharacterized protein n=1 Tax=Salix dunnii TaxID=1413687 RepID=A0A835N3K0_9ROSI|nr:hypothetical protein SADUNF_Sadunf05G0068900 [Salix dunnii]
MVIGDGILTPAMSVLPAVYGIRIKAPDLHESAEAMSADLGHFLELSVGESTVGDSQKPAAWVCKQEARDMFCLQFEESSTISTASHHVSNVSHYRVSALSRIVA